MNKRAIVSVVGKDQVGIINKTTEILCKHNINILDISQTILQDFFTMMMVIDASKIADLDALQEEMNQLGELFGLKISIQLEEIFRAMHRV